MLSVIHVGSHLLPMLEVSHQLCLVLHAVHPFENVRVEPTEFIYFTYSIHMLLPVPPLIETTSPCIQYVSLCRILHLVVVIDVRQRRSCPADMLPVFLLFIFIQNVFYRQLKQKSTTPE
jgi:hypothetical protein